MGIFATIKSCVITLLNSATYMAGSKLIFLLGETMFCLAVCLGKFWHRSI